MLMLSCVPFKIRGEVSVAWEENESVASELAIFFKKILPFLSTRNLWTMEGRESGVNEEHLRGFYGSNW